MKNLLSLYDRDLRSWVSPFEKDMEWNVLHVTPENFLSVHSHLREVNGIIAIAPDFAKMDFINKVERLANLLIPDPSKDVPFFWLVISDKGSGKAPALYGSFTRKFNKKIIRDLPANFYQANHDWKGWKDQFRTYAI